MHMKLVEIAADRTRMTERELLKQEKYNEGIIKN